MFDNAESLLQQIKLGEDSCLEFKEVRTMGTKIKGPLQNDLADELAAFANSRLGGVLLLGVSDSGVITGIDQNMLSVVETMVRNACSDSIEPLLFVTTRHMELLDSSGESKYIILVNISPSLFVHRSPGGYYTRLGDAKKPMPTELLARLFQQRSQVRFLPFDEQAVPETTMNDLNINTILPFLLEGTEPNEDTLLKLKLLTRDDRGDIRCSVGGVLLFGRDPQQVFPNAVIECVYYRGTIQDSDQQVDAQRVEGNLFQQIDETIAFVLRTMRVGAVKAPDRRETPQFADRAVFEAIVNAVAHRDYSIYGAKIRLFVFDNRLELSSPGALPNSVTVESLPMRQMTRNELITRFLGRTQPRTLPRFSNRKYMETRGDGVQIILRESEKLTGKSPLYQLYDDELRLTIYGYPFGDLH